MDVLTIPLLDLKKRSFHLPHKNSPITYAKNMGSIMYIVDPTALQSAPFKKIVNP